MGEQKKIIKGVLIRLGILALIFMIIMVVWIKLGFSIDRLRQGMIEKEAPHAKYQSERLLYYGYITDLSNDRCIVNTAQGDIDVNILDETTISGQSNRIEEGLYVQLLGDTLADAYHMDAKDIYILDESSYNKGEDERVYWGILKEIRMIAGSKEDTAYELALVDSLVIERETGEEIEFKIPNILVGSDEVDESSDIQEEIEGSDIQEGIEEEDEPGLVYDENGELVSADKVHIKKEESIKTAKGIDKSKSKIPILGGEIIKGEKVGIRGIEGTTMGDFRVTAVLNGGYREISGDVLSIFMQKNNIGVITLSSSGGYQCEITEDTLIERDLELSKVATGRKLDITGIVSEDTPYLMKVLTCRLSDNDPYKRASATGEINEEVMIKQRTTINSIRTNDGKAVQQVESLDDVNMLICIDQLGIKSTYYILSEKNTKVSGEMAKEFNITEEKFNKLIPYKVANIDGGILSVGDIVNLKLDGYIGNKLRVVNGIQVIGNAWWAEGKEELNKDLIIK